MKKRNKMSLLELILVIFPLTNGLGIDRFVFGDMKWGLIRLIVGVVKVGTLGLVIWIVDLVFLFLDKYNTDMTAYLK